MNVAVCAHLRVCWIVTANSDGSTSGWWACEVCNKRFTPEIDHHKDKIRAIGKECFDAGFVAGIQYKERDSVDTYVINRFDSFWKFLEGQ